MRPLGDMLVKPCCCTECCTHRGFDDAFALLWSDSISESGDCNAQVIDMQVRGTALYVLGRPRSNGAYTLSKWSLAGTQAWAIDLDEDFTPRRVDADASQVWVTGLATGSNDDLFAFDPADGSEIWSAYLASNLVGGMDVEPDGAGGVFVAIAQGRDSDCESPDQGVVARYNSSGTKIAGFGRNATTSDPFWHATSLLVLDGKLWVGSGGFNPGMCCQTVNQDWWGHLARYTFAGALELVALNPDVGVLDVFSYVSRLANVGSRLFAGYGWSPLFPQSNDGYCTVAEWNTTSGRLVAAFNLKKDSDAERSPVEGLAAGTDFLAIATGGILYKTDLDGTIIDDKRHRGTGHTGNYVAATVDADDQVYAGGRSAGCTITDDEVDATKSTCEPGDPCDCGMVSPFGRVVVDCGCTTENDGVPCDATGYGTWTGCLEDWPTEVETTYLGLVDGKPTWSYEFEWECDGTQDVEWLYIFDCESEEWDFQVLLNGVEFGTVSDIVGTCEGVDGYPGFTASYSVSAEQATAAGITCCGDGGDGCAGLGEECEEDGIQTDCCTETIPEVLTMTFYNVIGTTIDGLTITLTWNAGTSKWEGSNTLCGQLFNVTLECVSTFWICVVDAGSCNGNPTLTVTEVSCSPIELDVGNFSVDAGCSCCSSPPCSFVATIMGAA